MAMRIASKKKNATNFADPLYTQIGGLCWRKGAAGKEVLLVKSSSGRWIIPKGWPMNGKTPLQAAMIEAWEEAGVKRAKGKDKPIGAYMAVKRTLAGDEILGKIEVYPIKVLKTVGDYPEKNKRIRSWFSREEALDLIEEDGLRQILQNL